MFQILAGIWTAVDLHGMTRRPLGDLQARSICAAWLTHRDTQPQPLVTFGTVRELSFIDGEPATSIRPIYKTMQPVASHRLPGCSRVTWAQNCEVVTSGRGCLDDMLDSPQLSDCQHDDEVLQVPRALKLLHESTAAEVDKTGINTKKHWAQMKWCISY